MKKKSVFLILIAGICWGLIGMFSKSLLADGFSSVQITFLRCLIVTLGLGIYILFKNKNYFRIKLTDIKYFIGTGIFSIVFFNICYLLTIEIVSVSFGAILLYTAPCFIMILSVPLFKEKLTKRKITALILSFAGCTLVTGFAQDSSIPIAGIITGLLSGFGYALYTLFGRFALNKYHTLTVTFYTFLTAGTGIVLFCDLPEIITLSNNSMSVLNILLLGIVSTLVPYLCYTKGLEGIEAGTASIIACIEPVVAALVGIIVFDELLTIRSILGIILIFSAVVLINMKNKNKPKYIH